MGILIIVVLALPLNHNNITETDEAISTSLMTKGIKEDSIDNWEVFREALIQVESLGKAHSINKHTGAYGLYQILPKNGYLCEYNRLTGNNLTIEDLKNVEMQHIVFNYIQQVKNPSRNLRKALFIHNSRAMDSNRISYYEYKVMYNYYKLKCERYEKSN